MIAIFIKRIFVIEHLLNIYWLMQSLYVKELQALYMTQLFVRN